ncbi:hypothetical protein L211DRAFT_795920 [Terfezia boudieri ATCC MYA-4762]|uniref:Thioesterase/thiol ester dehydrase-isomerase n=1 Tax=Terfezia boudieri ATCC MYA-4762 TaxID=1051890 RepID=A0A3N4L795_9PEZI|nr:hypothetical protein L211DRAFT_795920 [Terfezia boudieri ATCC MYA-4762]
MAGLGTLRKPAAVAGGLISLLSPRGILSRLFTVFSPSMRGLLRLLGLLFLLVNIKSLPLMWHGRFYLALYHHLLRNRSSHPTPAHLFAPISTLSRPSLYECDVNMHKSNSTYFSDLDINRTHLVAHLIKRSLQLRRKRGERPMYVALAGVIALFRREIKPFEKYEMRSRVLSWDGKWIWVVSHFVKCGSNGKDHDMAKRIYASCLSKYVCKEGRKTVPPEQVLTESGLLPQRPEGIPAPDYGNSVFTPSEGVSGTSSPSTPDLVHISGSTLLVASARYDDVLDKVLEKSLQANAGEEGAGWTWQRIERERKRGMEVAKGMLLLDRLDVEVRDVERWGVLH